MRYRRDIDGLRALAVLPVVLHHAGIPGLSGGFIGVDVFFVISGFLITSIVATELAEDHFSLIEFYERRARRILPALIAVKLCSLVVGWFVLTPDELEDLGKSVVAAALFLSNIYFTVQLDYFATAADVAPMLHTWSLAVEEQFYLFFPPLLMFLFAWRGRRIALWAIALISGISLVTASALLSVRPEWVFYLIFFRAWELGLGAMLALFSFPVPRSPVLRDALGTAGLIAILAPVFLYDSATPFPGLAALPPVVGAAILIYIGTRRTVGWASALLAQRWLVWIGLISYSLYLWHWPILAFLRILLGSTVLPFSISLGAIVVSVLAAWASWRFIESPFRRKPPGGFGRLTIFGASAVALVAMVAVGGGFHLSGGLPKRLSERAAVIAAISQDRSPRRDECLGVLPEEGLCSIGASSEHDAAKDFLFWGDSHADAFRPGLIVAATRAGKTGLFAGAGGCLPIPQIRRDPENYKCTRLNEGVWDMLKTRKDMPLVILGARWALSVEGTRYPAEKQEPVRLVSVGNADDRLEQTQNADLFEAGLRETVIDIKDTGREIVILGPVPEIPWDVPIKLARENMLGWDPREKMDAALHASRTNRTRGILQNIARETEGVHYLPLADMFCDELHCRLTNSEGLPLYIDDDHVSRSTAEILLSTRLDSIWTSGLFEGKIQDFQR